MAVQKTFGEKILSFFRGLPMPDTSPHSVLWPYGSKEVQRVMSRFYSSFFHDKRERIFLLGINPGRLGAGLTGIAFTDPISLARDCQIPHDLQGGSEISSDFMYRMIARFGGPEIFYQQYYISSLCPIGFLYEGKNLNYYDVKGLPERLEAWLVAALWQQMEAGADQRVAFSIGQGKNYVCLQKLNARYGFFKRVEALPHPRWIMQYQRKKLDFFLALYQEKLAFYSP